MSHRVGLDRSIVVEAAAKLGDEEGIEQLTLGRVAERVLADYGQMRRGLRRVDDPKRA